MAEILDYNGPKALALRKELGEMIEHGIMSTRRDEMVELLLESGRIADEKKENRLKAVLC